MSSPARAVFLGSGAFAIPSLAALAAHPDARLVAVVSAPPRPSGRGLVARPSPVAAWAAERGIETLAPSRLRSPESIEAVLALRPDLLVLADYGQIVPAALLDAPAHGALNIHPSLLPRHRGASPIPAAIAAGDRETGVTLMHMDAGLDTGPVVARARHPLTGTETAPALEEVLAARGAALLAATLTAWLAGGIDPVPQDPSAATLTRPLRREDGRLDPTRPAVELERRIRAFQPWPGAFIDTPVGRIIVRGVGVRPAARAAPAAPGTLVAVAGTEGGQRLALATADGLLELVAVQPAGGRAMSGAELLRGRPSLVGSRVAPPDVA